jgi:hypothetical protein
MEQEEPDQRNGAMFLCLCFKRRRMLRFCHMRLESSAFTQCAGYLNDLWSHTQVPYQSQAWSVTFREIFQSPSPTSRRCKLQMAPSNSSGSLLWSSESTKESACEADLEYLTGPAQEAEQAHIRAIMPHMYIQHLPAVNKQQSLRPSNLEECAKAHSDAIERRALVQACARLLQARTKLINRLQQEVATGPRDVNAGSDDAGVHDCQVHLCGLAVHVTDWLKSC